MFIILLIRIYHIWIVLPRLISIVWRRTFEYCFWEICWEVVAMRQETFWIISNCQSSGVLAMLWYPAYSGQIFNILSVTSASTKDSSKPWKHKEMQLRLTNIVEATYSYSYIEVYLFRVVSGPGVQPSTSRVLLWIQCKLGKLGSRPSPIHGDVPSKILMPTNTQKDPAG